MSNRVYLKVIRNISQLLQERSILIAQIGILILTLVLWEVAANLVDRPLIVSSPSRIVKLFIEYATNGNLHSMSSFPLWKL